MRKIILIASLFSIGLSAIAQDQSTVHQRKRFMMGFQLAPSVDWLSVATEDVSLKAAQIKFQYGFSAEFAFANNYALVFGLEHKLAGSRLDYNAMAGDSANPALLPHIKNSVDTFYVRERNYKFDYITIPITLKLMTNQIGYFTYFGKFGVDLSVLVRARADDEGYFLKTPGVLEEVDNRSIFKEVSIFRAGLNVGAGAEWNFSGNTSLVFGLSYHHGFIDVLRDPKEDGVNNDQMLATWADTQRTVDTPFAQEANLQYVTLDIGILF